MVRGKVGRNKVLHSSGNADGLTVRMIYQYACRNCGVCRVGEAEPAWLLSEFRTLTKEAICWCLTHLFNAAR